MRFGEKREDVIEGGDMGLRLREKGGDVGFGGGVEGEGRRWGFEG